jgi:hypothetical protein
MWEPTNRGAIQVIATDELCCPLRVKLTLRQWLTSPFLIVLARPLR